MSFRRDTIELEIAGQGRRIEVAVPAGSCTATDLLPAARALADELSKAALERAAQQGRTLSCKAGCGACCRQMVGVSVIEAAGIANTVAALPPDRRAAVDASFSQAVHQLEQAGLLDAAAQPGQRTLRGLERGGTADTARDTSRRYFALRIACPFLEDESCSIYADRPMMCREYNVTSPAQRCATVHQGGVEKVTPPLHVGVSLGRVAGALLGSDITVLPLTLSLEWAAAGKAVMAKTLDGAEAYATWMQHMGGEVR